MFTLRLHTLMGYSAASLWCTSHGPAHCIWSAKVWREGDSQVDMLETLRQAASECFHRGVMGELDDLSDECGV